jgi:outer membrane protein assembly factor BamB
MKVGLDMLIFFLLLLIGSSWAVENVEITEPIDGATYDGDWLSVRAIVENDDELPDSVHHTLNGEPVILIPRLNTDWYTYMQDDLRQGYSESPAPTDNTILWSAPVTGTNHEFCSPVVYDGVVYFLADNDWGSSEDSVWALNAVSGNVLWARSAHGDTDDAVTVIGNLLYYSSDSLFCCNRFTGETLWSFAPEGGEGKISGTPVISDGNVYFDWSDDGSAQIDTVFALGAFSGNPIWKTALPEGNVQSCYTLYLGSLFVPTNDGPLYALDILDGTISWTNIDSQGGYWDSSPVVDDGVIYIGCYDGYVRAIDVNNGLTIWQTQIFTGAVEATPAFYDGVVYVGASMVFALSAADGDTLWSIDIGGIHGSPGMADGVLYWGDTSTGGIIHAVEMATGFEVWSYTVTGGSVYR